MTWDGVWSEPPVPLSEVWQHRLAPLLEKPGEWAMFGPFSLGAGKQAAKIRSGAYGDGFEVRRHTRNKADFIYVRYVGAKPKLKAVEG